MSAFLSVDAARYVSANPADMGEATLQGITVQMGGGTLAFHASYTEQVLPNNDLATDEDGNILYTVDVTLGGETITYDAFYALAERLRAMSVSGTLDSIQEPDGTPEWQLTLTTVQGRARTLAAYPMDAFFDVLAVDGIALDTISKEALEIALGEFAALVAMPEATAE